MFYGTSCSLGIQSLLDLWTTGDSQVYAIKRRGEEKVKQGTASGGSSASGFCFWWWPRCRKRQGIYSTSKVSWAQIVYNRDVLLREKKII